MQFSSKGNCSQAIDRTVCVLAELQGMYLKSLQEKRMPKRLFIKLTGTLRKFPLIVFEDQKNVLICFYMKKKQDCFFK